MNKKFAIFCVEFLVVTLTIIGVVYTFVVKLYLPSVLLGLITGAAAEIFLNNVIKMVS